MTAKMAPVSPSFRPATASDADRLIELMRAFYATFSYPFDETAARAALAPVLEPDSERGRMWIVEAEGETAGYVALMLGHSLEYRGRDAFLDELYVVPAWRKKGFAIAAMELVARACRELGVRALHLEVERDNTGAQALYRRFGFEDHDRYLMTRRIAP
jgi:ribosomal protein S18 acetylase RimI-like enzyme